MGSKTVAWSILVMGISLVLVVALWAWIGRIGPTYSADVLSRQQAILRRQYGLPYQPIITNPKILQTPPSLRGIKTSAAATATNTTTSTTVPATSSSLSSKTVSIEPGAANLADKAFSPNPISIKIGSTITWTDKDKAASHTVTSGTGYSDPNKGKEFDSGLSTLLTFGKMFSHTFNTAGVKPYFCQIHPTMVGKVVVVS